MKQKNFLILFITAFLIIVSSFQLQAQEKVSLFNELSEFMEKFEKKCPDAAASFYSLHDTIVNKEGILIIKEKELIALALEFQDSANTVFTSIPHVQWKMEQRKKKF